MTRLLEPSPFRGAVAIGGGLAFAASLLYFGWQYLVGFSAPSEPGSTAASLAINLALFTVFAMHHSVFARTGAKALIAHAAGPALERSVYVWIASALFLGVCVWWQPVAGQLWLVGAPWSWVLHGLQVAGAVLTLAAARRLDVLELAGVAQAHGRPPESRELDDRGPYGLVRHPIYFAWLLLVWPAPDMNGTRLAFAAISTAYLIVAIPFEERDLRKHFGAAYDRYAARVRWKMLPGIY